MKKKLFTLFSIGMAASAIAQNSGIITYDEKVKLEIHIEGADENVMAGLPKERTTQKVLYFTPDASLYEEDKNNKTNQDIDQQSEDGGRMVIKMKRPDDKVYCDLKNNKLIEQRDFMSRMFLIESDLSKQQWKMTGNQKMILNYPCQEATLNDTSKKVTVWFTSAIPVFTGPNGYSNLPGMVLAANIDDGKWILTATKVEMKDVDKTVLIKPKDGKKVTKEEYNKIVDEKKKEMQGEMGGGNMIIRINK